MDLMCFAVICPSPKGMLEFTVLRATDVIRVDCGLCGGNSDPYCIIQCGDLISTTDCVSRTTSPEFLHKVSIPVWNPSHQIVFVRILDNDTFSFHDCLGKVWFNVADLINWSVGEHAIDVLGSKGETGDFGLLWCSAAWRPFCNCSDGKQTSLKFTKGVLSVGVYSASHVPCQEQATGFWVVCDCIDDQNGSPKSVTKKTNKVTRPLTDKVDQDNEVLLLIKKVELMQKYDISCSEIAEVLEVDKKFVEELTDHVKKADGLSVGEHFPAAKELVWNSAMEFMISDLQKTQLTFSLVCKPPKTKKVVLGTFTSLLGDLLTLEDALSSSVDKLLRFEDTNIILKLRIMIHVPETDPLV